MADNVQSEKKIKMFLRLSARWAELRLTKKYKFHTGELVADACSKFPLSEIEKQYTQETIYKSREFFSKSLELTDAYIGFCGFFLLLFSLFFILVRIQPTILWFFCAVIGLALFFSFLSSKNTFGFWSRYMAAARRYNCFRIFNVMRSAGRKILR